MKDPLRIVAARCCVEGRDYAMEWIAMHHGLPVGRGAAGPRGDCNALPRQPYERQVSLSCI